MTARGVVGLHRHCITITPPDLSRQRRPHVIDVVLLKIQSIDCITFPTLEKITLLPRVSKGVSIASNQKWEDIRHFVSLITIGGSWQSPMYVCSCNIVALFKAIQYWTNSPKSTYSHGKSISLFCLFLYFDCLLFHVNEMISRWSILPDVTISNHVWTSQRSGIVLKRQVKFIPNGKEFVFCIYINEHNVRKYLLTRSWPSMTSRYREQNLLNIIHALKHIFNVAVYLYIHIS